MKTSTIIFIMSIMTLAIILGACTKNNIQPQPGEVYCTQEAKLCDDGSYVGRNASNDCAFDPCPTAPTTKATCGNGICEQNEYVPCPERAYCIWAGSCPQDCTDGKKEFSCNGKKYDLEKPGYCASATFPTGTSCIMTKEGDIVVPSEKESTIQLCLSEKNDFWCGGKHYALQNVKCEVIDPQPNYTCVDTNEGAILVPLSEEDDVHACINLCGVHRGREYLAEDGCNWSTCGPGAESITAIGCPNGGNNQ